MVVNFAIAVLENSDGQWLPSPPPMRPYSYGIDFNVGVVTLLNI